MKYNHAVIRDLMPLCIDGIASPESEQQVREHIAECPECAAEWAQMQSGSFPQSPAALPADTAKYFETAKRLRTHRIKKRLLTCGIVLMIAAGLYIRGLITSGAHFKMQRVMDDFLIDVAEQTFIDEHGFIPDRKTLVKPEYIYLGELESTDGMLAVAYAFVKHPEKELYSFTSCDGSRFDRYHLHQLYEQSGGGWGFLPKKNGIYMNDSGISIESSQRSGAFYYTGFYVTDPEVKTVTVKEGKQEHVLTPDENGFCCMRKRSSVEIREGWATDKNGTVRYTLQEIPLTTNYGEEYTGIDWVPAA